MNKAAPWSFKGVDFDARDAAREAARRAGMSLGEWLNDVIAEQARERGVPFDEVDEEGRLEAVTARLASLSGRGRRSARRLDAEDEDEMFQQRRRTQQARPRMEVRETAYDRGPRSHGGQDAPSNPEALLDAAIRAYERGASRGDQTNAAFSKVAAKLAEIESRLTRPAEEFDPRHERRLTPRGDSGEAEKLARLEARLEAMARDKDAEKSERSLRGLEKRLEEMAGRLEGGKAPARGGDDVTRIESKLNRLIEKLDTNEPSHALRPASAAGQGEAAPVRYEPAVREKGTAPAYRIPEHRRTAPAATFPMSDAIAQITRRQRDLDQRDPGFGAGEGARAAKISVRQEHEPAVPAAGLRDEVALLSRKLDETHRILAEREAAPVSAAPAKPDQGMIALKLELAGLSRRLEETQHAIVDRMDAQARAASQASPAADPAVAALKQEISALNARLSESQQLIVERLDTQAQRANQSLSPAPADPAVEALKQEIAALNRRMAESQQAIVERLDAQARLAGAPAAPPRPDPAFAALKQEVVALHRGLADSERAIVERIDAQAAGAHVAAPEFDSLRRRMDEMSRSMVDLAPREAVMSLNSAVRGLAPLGAVVSLEGAVRDLGKRVEDSLRNGSQEAILRPIADMTADLRRALADISPSQGIDSVERAIRDLGVKIEHSRDGMIDAKAVADIHAQTREIRDLLQHAVSRPAVPETIERQIARLADRLDGIGPGGSALEALAARGGEPTTDHSIPLGMIELLAKRIAELGAKIDDAVGQAGAVDQIDDLAKRLEDVHNTIITHMETPAPRVDTSSLERMMREIAEKLERPAPQAPAEPIDTSHLENMLKQVGDRFDTAAQGVDSGAIEHLRREIAGLAATVESLGKSSVDIGMFEEIRHDIARLSNRLESAPIGADNGSVAETRALVAALTQRLDQSDNGARAIGSMESALAELSHRIDDSRHLAADAAEAAARNAAQTVLAEAMAQLPRAGAADEALPREIADLRAMQETIDRRTYSTLTAVHETLEKVVDRIAVLEEEVVEARPGRLSALGDAPVFAPAPPMTQAPAVQAPPSAARPEPAMPQNDDFHNELSQLLNAKPGAGEMPSLAEQFAGDAPSSEPMSAPEERKRWLDAARRQAQANVATASTDKKSKAAPDSRAKPAETDKASDARTRALAAHKAWAIGGGKDPGDDPARSRVANNIAERVKIMSLPRKPLIFIGVTALVLFSGYMFSKRFFRVNPRAEIVEITGGKTPRAAEIAPEDKVDALVAPAPAEPAPAAPSAINPGPGKRGASLESPAGASAMDRAPTASIGSGAAIAARPGGLQTAADGGDPAAQYELGVRYADGRGMTRDAAKAVEWLTKSAKQRVAPAAYRLGSIYERGAGGERNLDKAREWYSRAAEAGNIRAMHNMAVLSAEGVDGKPDYATASDWFRQAADFGVRDSQYNLAILYARGLGVEQSLPRSWSWFAIAAAQGDTDAAKKQEDVGARLDTKQLAEAKAFVAGFHPKAADKAANEVAQPPGGWDAPSARMEPKRDMFPSAPSPTAKPPAPAPAPQKRKVTSL